MERMVLANYERLTVDAEALVVGLLMQVMPIEVANNILTDQSFNPSFPLVTVRCTNGRMVQNGGPFTGAWSFLITIDVVAANRDLSHDLADMVYRALHTLDDEGGYIPGLGGITNVEDNGLPRKVTTSKSPAGELTQCNGSWTAILRLQE